MGGRYQHEIKTQLFDRPNPVNQQTHTPKSEGAYVFLYLCIVFGIVLFILLGWGIYRDHQKKSKKRAEEKQKSKKGKAGGLLQHTPANILYPDIGKTFAKSVPRGPSPPTPMATIVEEVQPPKRKSSSPPGMYTTNVTLPMHADRQQHQKRKQYSFVSTVGSTTPATSSTTLDGTSTAPSSEGTSSSAAEDDVQRRLKREVSRQESFPFEKFGIPIEEREPRTARVENMRPMTEYYAFTQQPSFLQEEDEEGGSSSSSIRLPSGSEEEEESRPSAEFYQLDEGFGNASTLPMRHNHGRENVVSNAPWPDE